MTRHFELFQALCRPAIHRIARQTRGEMLSGEVENEAWLLAGEMQRKRGRPLDLSTAEDREELLRWLYMKLVKRADKSIRFAVRLDRGWDDEDGERAGEALARLLTAPSMSDPQQRQHLDDDRAELVTRVGRSYSQAGAYFLLLARFEWDFKDLANRMLIAVPTLRDRIRRAVEIVRIQPSLFDGREWIPVDLQPRAITRSIRRLFSPPEYTQADMDLHS